MGVFSFLKGTNPIAAVADSTIGKVVGKLLDFIPDPVQKAAAQQAIMEMNFAEEKLAMDAAIAQINVNVEEAKNANVFVAGPRPFILWVCGFALAYNYILAPIITSIILIWHPDFLPPKLDMVELMALLTGLLGLGYMHSNDHQAIIAAKQ